jgi:hypothetical protein
VTALLVLSFLGIVGAALLSATSVDVRIADNYRTNTQVLFVAESGIDAGRAMLRAAGDDLNDLLETAAGGAGMPLETSLDLATLLASDDQPLLPVDAGQRAAGHTLVDSSGNAAGTYHVWLRNDHVDGESAAVDTNRIVTLISIARIGNATKTLEVVVRRADFPSVPAALTLDGELDDFDNGSSANFFINGNDQASPPQGNQHAIGVITALDDANATAEINGPPDRSAKYSGDGGVTPDVENVSADLNDALTTVHGLEDYADSYAAVATDVYNPAWNGATALGSNIGGPGDYPITVVNGNAQLGPITGDGVLVVRGEMTMSGNTRWYGLILVIGQGHLTINGSGSGTIRGAMLVARTRDAASRSATNPLGDLLANRGEIHADLNGGGSGGIGYDSAQVDAALNALPYRPMSINEH